MIQTYPVDNLLFILKSELEENSNLKQTFLNMEGISDIVEYLISDNYNEAKYRWLSFCKPFIKITRNQWNAEGTDKNLGTIPLNQYLKRRYIYTCTSERCPSRQNDVNIEYTSEMDIPPILLFDMNEDLSSGKTSLIKFPKKFITATGVLI